MSNSSANEFTGAAALAELHPEETGVAQANSPVMERSIKTHNSVNFSDQGTNGPHEHADLATSQKMKTKQEIKSNIQRLVDHLTKPDDDPEPLPDRPRTEWGYQFVWRESPFTKFEKAHSPTRRPRTPTPRASTTTSSRGLRKPFSPASSEDIQPRREQLLAGRAKMWVEDDIASQSPNLQHLVKKWISELCDLTTDPNRNAKKVTDKMLKLRMSIELAKHGEELTPAQEKDLKKAITRVQQGQQGWEDSMDGMDVDDDDEYDGDDDAYDEFDKENMNDDGY